MNQYLILGCLWFSYLAIHSILASGRVKSTIKRATKIQPKAYRLYYSIISTIGLAAIVLFILNISYEPLFKETVLTGVVSLTLIISGGWLIQKSFNEYKLSSFIGLADENSEFKKTGILKVIRHPIYTGTILMIIGAFIFFPTIGTLISVLCILLYLPVGIYYEEKKLIEIYGKEYLHYKMEVPALFPKLKLFKKAS